PDFNGSEEALKIVVNEKPEILNHNIETVERLYPLIRPQADYRRSLELLCKVKKIDRNIKTKSGIMVGLGEIKEEIVEAMTQLRNVFCDILTIGQYLRPSEKHYPVIRYYHPDEFKQMKEIGEKLGFLEVKSSPLVRSSYQLVDCF
ncbi:MAG: lipoyl synthase, partial [Candidatus Helarchaeota archaeon]|nr:lipoyl synthase [Candidatus Helarchaeota archaeon]